MQKLVRGLHSFQQGYFAKHEHLFRQLATAGQQPEALFITCCDSRVVPNLITDAAPGDLFIVRNLGNIIPTTDSPCGTMAAIEYAIGALEVEDVVVCGHTRCGAMQGVLHPETLERLPGVRRWVAQANRVRTIVRESYSHLDEASQLTAAVQENVLAQLENLGQHPWVRKRVDEARLRVSGWVFDIETGKVYEYDPAAASFALLPSPEGPDPALCRASGPRIPPAAATPAAASGQRADKVC